MRLKWSITTTFVAVGCALGGLAASGRLAEVFAQDTKDPAAPAEGTQLPRPDPRFAGRIGETYKDSVPSYPSR